MTWSVLFSIILEIRARLDAQEKEINNLIIYKRRKKHCHKSIQMTQRL